MTLEELRKRLSDVDRELIGLVARATNRRRDRRAQNSAPRYRRAIMSASAKC